MKLTHNYFSYALMNILKKIKRSKRKLLSTNFSFKSKIITNERRKKRHIEH